jgi:hypothetical protein
MRAWQWLRQAWKMPDRQASRGGLDRKKHFDRSSWSAPDDYADSACKATIAVVYDSAPAHHDGKRRMSEQDGIFPWF